MWEKKKELDNLNVNLQTGQQKMEEKNANKCTSK